MKVINPEMPLGKACILMRTQANTGTWDGTNPLDSYFQSCRWDLTTHRAGCTIVLTRDVGHHSGGWWKNPDYERCYHLSVCFPGGRNKRVLNQIAGHLFGAARKRIWVEPPFSEVGRSKGVWHYRLFFDEQWQHAIKPRGEVYSTQFTDRGWKSFSQMHRR